MNLFVYGTLQIKEIWEKVTKKPFLVAPAHLNDYEVRLIKNDIYPSAVFCKGERITGLLIRELSLQTLLLIDTFEGTDYKRVEVLLTKPNVKAFIYLLKEDTQLSTRTWSELEFREKHLRRVLKKIK